MALKRREFLKRLAAGFATFVGLVKAKVPTSAPKPSVRRLVLIKVDGLPQRLVDRFVAETDPQTGRSLLPWFKHVFYDQGARLTNFYVRGMSLSAPSWSLLDTGQHLQIKGNVEFDRLTSHAYDYLNFIPFYLENATSKRVDMPGVEVLDELGTPLLIDAYEHDERYQSFQLYQRGVHWSTFERGLKNRLGGLGPKDVIDEWTMGFESRGIVPAQLERELIEKLQDSRIRYLDYYTTEVDHRTHHNRDRESQLAAIQDVDASIGRIWTAIEKSSLAKETVLVLVSDHGTNTDENIISQGYNLVKLLGSAAGGGHHVVTKRRLMMDYSIKSIYPFVPLITTTTQDSYYLKGQSTDYPTALLDFDGNERAAIHLRNSDLNLIHILWQQLQRRDLSATQRHTVSDAALAAINRNLAGWKSLSFELDQELTALHELIEKQRALVAAQSKNWTQADRDAGRDQSARRESARLDMWLMVEKDYQEYLRGLANLLALSRANLELSRMKIEDVIARGAMGQPNTIHQLQNYVIGVSPKGMVLTTDGVLDMRNSFVIVDYFGLLRNVTVRNNVQQEVSNEPIDFLAVRISPEDLMGSLGEDSRIDEAIWLFKSNDRQALILSRHDPASGLFLRYCPVARLAQDTDGKVSFDKVSWQPGLPLRIWEDPRLKLSGSREDWLNDWHTEREWIRAIHRTDYSNSIIGLHEQFSRHQTDAMNTDEPGLSNYERLLRRFRHRRRRLVEPDLFVHASNHWNFDVRGFNPGANHGSFLRVSTHSTLMFAGGENTGIPRGAAIDEPYDSLDLMPTLFALTNQMNGQRPNSDLWNKGFRQFPGRKISELFQA